MTATRHHPMRHIGLFIFIILTWGLAWPMNKIGLSYMSPLWFCTVRLVAGTATMFLLVAALGKLTLPQLKDIPLILIIGTLEFSAYLFLANLGLSYLPAGRASILAYTTPLWVMPLSILLFGEQPSKLKWFGFGLSLIGLVLLLNPWDLQWTNGKVLFGAAMLLLGSLSWAVAMLCARYMKWNKSPLEMMPWLLLVATIPIALFAVITEPSVQIAWDSSLLLSLVYTGFFVTGLSYWSGVVINRELPSIVVSLGFLAVPVFSMMVSAIFMHESIHLATATAMMLILTGLACVVV